MKKAALALLAAAVLGAAAAAIGWAAAGDSAVIHACVAKGSDLVRIPAAGGRAGRTRPVSTGTHRAGRPGPQGRKACRTVRCRDPGTEHRDVASCTSTVARSGRSTVRRRRRATRSGSRSAGMTATRRRLCVRRPEGGGAGKVQLTPIVITKPIDKSTPKLFEALVSGRPLPEVQIDFVRPDDKGGDEFFYSVKLEQVVVTAVHQLDAGKASGDTLEQISLDFQSIEITYGDDTASGGSGPTS